ncbi:hypothetical protein [Streptomyces sp. NPDC096012]|uniref:hypothetical protein n=1 Tax=Streptomyces sp. NPDC096012 TaxID=3155684 RepID=UPI00336A59FC
MQYELRQNVIEPRRQTYQALVDRQGDRPAGRYEEGTVGIQPTENFHYRPLWAPDREIYDERFSRLRLSDADAFADPRQYYYAPYVAARATLHDGFGKTLDYVEKRDLLSRLPEGWRAVLGTVVVPLRHYESGAQLITVAGARLAWGAPVAQCLTYAAFDRVGLAQLLSRIGITLAGGSDEALSAAKLRWVEGAQLQGLRRTTEELLVEEDWAVGLVGLDLVDQLLYPVLYRALDEAALLGGAGAYSLLAQHLTSWYGDHRRWLDALYAAWAGDASHGEVNRAVLAEVVHDRLPGATQAVCALAAAVDALVGCGAEDATRSEAEAVARRFAGLGAGADGTKGSTR